MNGKLNLWIIIQGRKLPHFLMGIRFFKDRVEMYTKNRMISRVGNEYDTNTSFSAL